MCNLYRVIMLISVSAPILADDSSVLVDAVINDQSGPAAGPTTAADQVSAGWGERDVPLGNGFAPLDRNGHLQVLSQSNPSRVVDDYKSALTCEQDETQLANRSREILKGFIHGYLSKLANREEEKCIEDLGGCMISDLFTAGSNAANATNTSMTVIKHRNHERQSDELNLLNKLLETGSKLMDVGMLATKMLQDCLNKDAIDMLNTTAHNFINIQFIKNALVVNLVNITELLADSMERWNHTEYNMFGYDLGFTIRKILLTSATGPLPHLPEGMPQMQVFQEVMEGVSEGFFIKGTDVTAYNKADPRQHFELDLKSCIADNLPFYHETLNTVWLAIAQIQNIVKEGQMHNIRNIQGLIAIFQSPQFQPVISHGQAMIGGIPRALMKCNITSANKEMLEDLFHSIKNVRIKTDFPPNPLDPDEIDERVQNATHFWEIGDFKNMGNQIGILFRELLLQMFHQKYAVDDLGRLRLITQTEAQHGMFAVSLVLMVAVFISAAIYRAATPWKAECRSMYQVAGEQDPETLYPGSEDSDAAE